MCYYYFFFFRPTILWAVVRGKGLFLLHRAESTAAPVEMGCQGINILNMDLANEGLGPLYKKGLYLGMDLYH